MLFPKWKPSYSIFNHYRETTEILINVLYTGFIVEKQNFLKLKSKPSFFRSSTESWNCDLLSSKRKTVPNSAWHFELYDGVWITDLEFWVKNRKFLPSFYTKITKNMFVTVSIKFFRFEHEDAKNYFFISQTCQFPHTLCLSWHTIY